MSISLGILAFLASTPSSAWQSPAACTRDVANDPAAIRALFALVDRMGVRELYNSQVQFYLEDRGSISIDDFVLHINYHQGREDSAPLRVTGIKPLQFDARPRQDIAYVVETRRSAWYDRGSAMDNGYTDHGDTWLVHFSGCGIDHVSEVSNLYYLLEEPD